MTRVLVLASVHEPDARTLSELRAAVCEVTDWSSFTQHLERHRIGTIVVPMLQAHASELVPVKTLRAMRTRNKIQRVRGEMATSELIRLIGLFEQQDISPIVYKGPAAAELFYGGIENRPFSDLDFLVRRTDIERVESLLIGEGYSSNLPTDPALRRLHLQHQKELGMQRNGLTVEPHFSLTPARIPFSIDYDSLWREARPLTLATNSTSGRVLVWGPEHAALIYAVIAGMLEWRRLPKIVDFARLATHSPLLDWQSVAEHAETTGMLRVLHTSVLLANELLDAPFPATLLANSKNDRAACALALDVVRSSNNPLVERRWLPKHHRIVTSIYWRMRERPRDRFRYLLNTTTVPRWQNLHGLRLPQSMLPVLGFLTPFLDYVAYPVVQLLRRLRSKVLRR